MAAHSSVILESIRKIIYTKCIIFPLKGTFFCIIFLIAWGWEGLLSCLLGSALSLAIRRGPKLEISPYQPAYIRVTGSYLRTLWVSVLVSQDASNAYKLSEMKIYLCGMYVDALWARDSGTLWKPYSLYQKNGHLSQISFVLYGGWPLIGRDFSRDLNTSL